MSHISPFTPTGVRIALALGIAGSAFASGAILSISWISVPALIQTSSPSSPSSLARTWERVYNRGKSTMPFIAATAASSYAYLAYSIPESPANSHYPKLFTLAALLTFGIVPFTFLAMIKTNSTLISKAREEETGVVEKSYDETKELALRWIWLNAARGMLPLAGAVVGFVAIFS